MAGCGHGYEHGLQLANTSLRCVHPCGILSIAIFTLVVLASSDITGAQSFRRHSAGIPSPNKGPNNHRCLFFLWRAYKYQSRLCQCTTPADELYVIFKPLICIQLQYLFMSAANRLAAGSSMATLLANEHPKTTTPTALHGCIMLGHI